MEQKTLSPVAGYDLVFSPPKSVSLLHALGGPEVAHAIDQTHLAAWQAALGYLEREACVTRKGKNGVTREAASGFVAAAYRHRTSRAQDPHLHTHVIVANMARSPDGTWRALDGEALLKTYRLAAGYLYQAQLRFELTRTLGVEWERPEQGMSEIVGIPPEAIRAFSQRRAQVVDYLERHGATGFYAARVAALETRDRKEAIDLPRLREEWQARAEEYGLGRRAIRDALARTAYRELDGGEIRDATTRMLSPVGLTERQTTFTATDAVKAWAESNQRGAPTDQVLALTKSFLASTQLEPIDPATPGRPATYSTDELLRLERDALAVVERGVGAEGINVRPALIEQVACERAGSLDSGQLSLLDTVCSSPDRVVCVVGLAGAGKTTALAAVADVVSRNRIVAFGAAPSGIAAEHLARETGLPSSTLHRLLLDARRAGGLPHRSLLVVDEAGMADTRTLTQALTEIERADGKIVLVGDPEQLPAVGAGGLFASIVARHGAVHLAENRRQHDELERRALAELRDGESRAYLSHAATRSRLVVADAPTHAKAQLVADWWNDEGKGAMIAYRRVDVADLNAAAHALMDEHGRLGSERLLLSSGTELAAGDRVVCARNDRQLRVVNGTSGTVTRVDLHRREIAFNTDAGREITLSADYLDAGHVRHAYALTGHKMQGLTVDHAFVLAVGEGSLKEWGYVALSRARQLTRLYTTTAELDAEIPPAYRPARPDSIEQLAEALTRAAAETTALERKTQALAKHCASLQTERKRTARELREATANLERSGILSRVRHGGELRAEITQRKQGLEKLDEELESVNRQLRSLRLETLNSRPKRSERTVAREQERDLGRSL